MYHIWSFSGQQSQGRLNLSRQPLGRCVVMDSDSIYQFKFFIRGISPMIWRRVLVRSGDSLRRLHEVIQVSMNWDDDHIYVFHIHGKDYGTAGSRTGNLDEPLSELRLRPNERFLYEYDFTTSSDVWQLDIRFEASLPLKPGLFYPHCKAGHRSGPPACCRGSNDYVDRQYQIEAALITDLVEALASKDINKIRRVVESNHVYSREWLNQSFREHFSESCDLHKRRRGEVQSTVN